ncbi:MRG-domain-containing protein [Phanerochaete sordida]|uniref:Chromatin modification-related protein EAF3 n=1 Tax=Phanerochaete sordida TaxID=48140 RepID=A0A9P3GI10_9APHY|nr:MRG-domain-containing protein [Phanerochaete sordida]
MASSANAGAQPSPFQVNERVLCYHGPLIYEAKILKSEHWDEQNTKNGEIGPHFFVHYKGWKQTWDEWVDRTRLLKFTEDNIKLQKTLSQANAAASAAQSGSASGSGVQKGVGKKDFGRTLTGRKDGRGVKRGRDDDDNSKRPDMKLNVPEQLKVLLVDDWEAVTKNNQLVPLPRTPNVVEILKEFEEHVLSNPKNTLRDPKILLPTIIAGLQTYFDRALGANLLYRFERPQYADVRRQYVTGQNVIVGQEKEMSTVYGAEHLLRMLVSMPQMVATSTMDPESVALVRDYVNELMAWMLKERDRIFVKEYESASIQYQSISRS